MTDPRTDLADYVRALTEPIQHAETYPLRSAIPGGVGQEVRVWRTIHPSLLDQLAAAVEPSGNGDGTIRGYESSPTARLDAIDQLARISREAITWFVQLGYGRYVRPDVVTNLRGLVGIHLDHDGLRNLARDAGRWVTGARIVTGWDMPARSIPAPCMECGSVGTLRARPEPIVAKLIAMCTRCGETWTGADGTIYVLGEWVKRSRRPMAADVADTGELEKIGG